LDRKGKVLSLFRLLKKDSCTFFGIASTTAHTQAFSLLTQFILSSEVSLTDVSSSFSHFILLGAKADTFLEEHDIETKLEDFNCGKLEDGSMYWRENLLGIQTWHFLFPTLFPNKTKNLFTEHLPSLSAETFFLLHLQGEVPLFPETIGSENILLEAAKSSHFYARGKGCYPGQEVIERLLTYNKGKAPFSLRTLSLSGEHFFAKGTDVLNAKNEKCGQVLTCGYNPYLKQTSVVVRAKSNQPTHELQMSVRGR